MAQTVNLNIIPKGIPDVVNASQYDVGRVVQFALYDGATPYNVPGGATVQIAGKKGDNTIFCYDQADGVVSVSGNVVTITSTQQMTAFAGEVLAQLRVINNSVTPATVLATVNFKMLIQVRPDAEGDISETEIPAIIALAEAEMYNAEAWAKGTKNGVPVSSSEPQYNDHSKYWAEKAQEYAVGAVHYKSVITFAQIPVSGMVNGDMYNISDDFTTDNRFAEGSGKYCSAGTNIIWDEATSLWDIAGGLGGVTSWNNRRGDITPQANDYTAAQVKFSEGVSVADELGNKQPKTLTTAITIGGVSQTTVEGALGALNTAKPDSSSLGSAAVKNVPASGNASTTEVVMGNDSRLTDTRNAADVYEWAKAATKPSYDYSEITNTPSAHDATKVDTSVIADAFDATATYAVGDYVMYNGVLYKCGVAHTGAWDANDFTQTLVSDEFGSGGGGGGQTTEYRYNIITKSTGNYDASITVIKYVDNIVASSTDYLYSSLSTPVTLDGFLTLSYASMKYTMTLLQASQSNPAGYSEQWAYNATVDLTQTFLVSGADLSYIAPLFSAATAYAVGDLVTHDGKFYKCTTAHAAGAWNSAHFTVTDTDTAFVHQNNVVTSHVLGIGNYTEVGSWNQSNDFDFDGSVNRYLMAITALVSIPASAWSSTVDSDGYYTASVTTGNAYFNTWVKFFVECGGSPTNIEAKPTAEQKAAFSLVETFHMNTSNSTNIMTCYAKTKPTTDFYIIVSGWFMS